MALENKYDLIMIQGSTFGLSITVNDSAGNTKNLVSHSARMQLRPSYSSQTITENLTTANGEILLGGEAGTIDIKLSAERTANIKVDLTNGKPPKSNYVYDFELIDSANQVSKLLYGDVTVYGEVTR